MPVPLSPHLHPLVPGKKQGSSGQSLHEFRSPCFVISSASASICFAARSSPRSWLLAAISTLQQRSSFSFESWEDGQGWQHQRAWEKW